MSKMPIPSNLMDAVEVAAHFNVSRTTIWRWVKSGVLPKPVKLGGLVRWRRDEIEAVTAAAA